jgi:hypothetical protein
VTARQNAARSSLAEGHGALGDGDAVAVTQGQEQPHQGLPHGFGYPCHHADVDQGQLVVVGQQDVAGMGIGVEEALDQDLVQVALEQLVRQRRAIQVQPAQRSHGGHLGPGDVRHREDRRGGVVLDRLGDDETVVGLQDSSEADQVAGLPPEIELVLQCPTELVEQLREAIAPSCLAVAVGEGRQIGEGGHVLGDLLADSRPLHLDDDRAAVAHRRPVDLAERSRCQGSGVEGAEGVGQPGAQLGLHDVLHLVEPERLHVVLEAGQGFGVHRRDEVGAGREELAQLDERGAHGLQVVGQFRGVGDHLGIGFVEVPIEPRLAHQVAPAVLDQKAGYVPVSTEMVGPQ